MNSKFILSTIALFVILMASGFVIHGVLLSADYEGIANLMRAKDDQMQHFGYIVVADVLTAAAFAWIYARGREDKPWLGQGIRFGIAIAVLSTIPVYLIYFAVQPLPASLVAKQILLDSSMGILLGITVAWINR